MKQRGFTLIELLVVIAIIGLLATLAVISLENARRDSRDAKRQSDLRTLQSAVELYINDNEDPPPIGTDWNALGTALAAYVVGHTPEPPGKSLPDCPTGAGASHDPADWRSGDCFVYCTDGENYLITGTLEGEPAAGDLDDNTAFIAGQCISSGGLVSDIVLSDDYCGDDAASGGENVFCVGS